jgi:SAM-dependent methyltransferase
VSAHDDAAQFWDGLYGEREQVWSGEPNAMLVHEVEALAPGTALELGCGEGGDAIWLATRGWHVTAVDVSQVALDRAARAASAAGLAARIEWRRVDLTAAFPDGRFDLVAASFLHAPIEFPRDAVLRRAATAVAPGGTLLVIGHASAPPWSQHHDHDDRDHDLPGATEVLASLDLDGGWDVVVCEDRSRDATGPDGQRAVLLDSVVRVRRR